MNELFKMKLGNSSIAITEASYGKGVKKKVGVEILRLSNKSKSGVGKASGFAVNYSNKITIIQLPTLIYRILINFS